MHNARPMQHSNSLNNLPKPNQHLPQPKDLISEHKGQVRWRILHEKLHFLAVSVSGDQADGAFLGAWLFYVVFQEIFGAVFYLFDDVYLAGELSHCFLFCFFLGLDCLFWVFFYQLDVFQSFLTAFVFDCQCVSTLCYAEFLTLVYILPCLILGNGRKILINGSSLWRFTFRYLLIDGLKVDRHSTLISFFISLLFQLFFSCCVLFDNARHFLLHLQTCNQSFHAITGNFPPIALRLYLPFNPVQAQQSRQKPINFFNLLFEIRTQFHTLPYNFKIHQDGPFETVVTVWIGSHDIVHMLYYNVRHSFRDCNG